MKPDQQWVIFKKETDIFWKKVIEFLMINTMYLIGNWSVTRHPLLFVLSKHSATAHLVTINRNKNYKKDEEYQFYSNFSHRDLCVRLTIMVYTKNYPESCVERLNTSNDTITEQSTNS